MSNTGKQKKIRNVFIDGFTEGNPFLVCCLGLGASLSMTHSVTSAGIWGLLSLVNIVFSSVILSALKRVIPDTVRIPCSILIIAGGLTITGMFVSAYVPTLQEAIGSYVPQLMTCCLSYGHAELYARKNSMSSSFFHALGCGGGYLTVLVITAFFRRLLGSGVFFGMPFLPDNVEPLRIFQMVPGALFILAVIAAVFNAFSIMAARIRKASEEKKGGRE